MDPLSLTASILAVVGAVKGVARGLQKIKKYRDAPQKIDEFLSEINALESTLQALVVLTAQEQDGARLQDCQNIADCVHRADVVINDLCLLLSIDSKGTQPQRTTWLRKQKDVDKLLDSLKVIRGDINIALEIYVV